MSFDTDTTPHSKCVLNFKKYIHTAKVLCDFFPPTSFNISLFIENSWKPQSAICFLIKFRPHSHRQMSLLFLCVRLLRNNVVAFTGRVWLSPWWWASCKHKKTKTCLNSENQLPIQKHIHEPTPQGSISHTDPHIKNDVFFGIYQQQLCDLMGHLYVSWKFSSRVPLQMIFNKC